MSEKLNYLLDPLFIVKKEDPSRPTIACSIGPHVFHNAFCDLGASINIMPRVIYDKILGGPLSTAHFQLQMADQSLRNPEGLATDILVKIRDIYIPTYFIILDMGHNEKTPLLGRPFLNTINTVLHVGSGHVSFHMQGQTMRCPFNGFKMHKHIKINRPKKQPHKGIKQVWQVEASTSASASTSPDMDVPPSSKK
jgi:hypothetical protein